MPTNTRTTILNLLVVLAAAVVPVMAGWLAWRSFGAAGAVVSVVVWAMSVAATTGFNRAAKRESDVSYLMNSR